VGETEAWEQSQRRTRKYTKQDWRGQAEMDATNAAFVSAMADGEGPTSERAMDAASSTGCTSRNGLRHSAGAHRSLGDMYIADPRFTKNYEDISRDGSVRSRRDPRERRKSSARRRQAA